ncbi:zinc finger BED domain-containing protein 4-like [Dysidea avara]|uniref:zinc finger BED domain-containing protein 4-like n=1 Tax=Dysidea avara TaxID=196820 RepID=UPI0033185C78
MAEELQDSDDGGGTNASMKVKKKATFYQWNLRHYFTVVEEGDKNMRVRCKLCAPSNKTLSSARSTTANLRKHLNKVHQTTPLSTPLVPFTPDKTRKRKLDGDDDDEQQTQTKRQCTLPSMSKLTPSWLRGLVAEYIVEDMLPLSTVESPAFNKLVRGISSSNVQLSDRKSFTVFLEEAYDSMIAKVMGALETVETVCTTADVWTANRRSYLGMTVHWIDPSTLKRHKAAIACTRVMGHHIYGILTSKIESAHESFGLSGKVSATVTNNGFNFAKAFTTFVHPIPDVSLALEPSDTAEDQDDIELKEGVTFLDVAEFMVPDQLDTQDYLIQIENGLPPHQKCAAYTLNLIASTDVDKFLSSSPASRSLYSSAFGKCMALWNRISRLTVASSQLQDKLKGKLLVPSPTRWNTCYDAIERMVENSLADLNDLCAELDFNEGEIMFLKEYCTVLKPLSRGLDILQDEDNCYYGTLLPTLETIIKKIKAKKSELSATIVGLVDTINGAIRQRFSAQFDSHDAIIAAVASPKFKLRWVEAQETRDQYKQMLLDEMRLLRNDEFQVEEVSSKSQEKEKKKDFYEFDTDDETSVDVEATEYLRDAKKLECLQNYPTVKKVFLKYNTILPSSAPVERLFSSGALVLTPKQNQLTDVWFERLMVMRFNEDFIDFKY